MGIPEDTLKQFKEKVRVEKCDGEITEAKLWGFLASYNKKGKRYSIYNEFPNIVLKDRLFQTERNYDVTVAPSKIDAMLAVMIFVIVNNKISF